MAMASVNDQSAILEITSEVKTVNCVNKSDSCNNSKDSSMSDSNGLLQSPSAESLSTFENMDRTSELILEANQEIVSRVDNPQKVVEPWGTFVSFRIRTKCRRWDQDEKEYVVRRRYNDFKALRERLVENSLVVVPPLPCRHTLLDQLDRYSKDFVLQRLALLNIFIKRLVMHSILSHSEELKAFLTVAQSELSTRLKPSTVSRGPSSYLAGMADSICALATGNAHAANTCRTRDPEFSAASDYVTALKDKLDRLENISTRINRERIELATEMTNMVPAFETWAQVEKFNRDTLGRHVCPPDAGPGELLRRMSQPCNAVGNEHARLSREYPYRLGGPVQECALYADSAKTRLRERDALQAALEGARQKAARGGDGADVEETHDRLQMASEALRSDLNGWHRQKDTDVRLLLTEVARAHIQLYERSLAAWEAALPIHPQGGRSGGA